MTRPNWTRLFLAVAGLAIAIYMTVEHFTANDTLACTRGAVVNCEQVTTSSWSTILGIPVAVLGVVYFLIEGALIVVGRSGGSRVPAALARFIWECIGMVMVLYFVWVELVPLGAICSWCTGVHVVTALLFILGVAELVA